MKRYVVHIVRYVYYPSGLKRIKKRVEVKARSAKGATNMIKSHFPDYQISMFWPKWPA